MWTKNAPLLAALSLPLLACGGSPKAEPAVALAASDVSAARGAPGPAQGLAIAPEVRNLCAIGDALRVPRFGFDQANVEDHHQPVLDQLAECMRSGPLKGKRVRLIGRADPRGEHEYNLALGAARASRVHAYLTERGVQAEAMKITSRGELDATGQDEEGWAMDRRVDVVLD
jgi:peptidoglycan-associated lipoprotein